MYEYTRQILLAEWDENNTFINDFYIDVFVHEIGHNWDSDLELTSVAPALAGEWDNFMAVAGWQDNGPGPGYTLSGDGQWWYQSNAWFYDNYARTNPYEDMATAWEYFFEPYQDPQQNHASMQPRMDVLDRIMTELGQWP